MPDKIQHTVNTVVLVCSTNGVTLKYDCNILKKNNAFFENLNPYSSSKGRLGSIQYTQGLCSYSLTWSDK